ncbi:TIGR04024 family LLM class F420-dependent oxidoreductase [Halospeciosus flavus]|uniref:TIGR04024 family LLM class F420-dependent oxidoreductase n=1 Tax=Halospeciosus flavus TaxID=3032283 RepID=A0ABD5Z1V5_9EURY|nr:TIGR04024 family LLM class F420-dependent oxidoreductase [Halospeciosus flavus]
MTERTVHLPVAAQSSLDDFVELGKRAEALGYDTAWLPETWGRDAVTILATLATETNDIGLGTSILPVYSRSAALLGQTAATLQEASDGRFRLGLGPSGPAVVENWHGVDFGNPLKRTREYTEVVQQVLSGEEVDYDGDVVDVSGFRLRCDPPDPVPGVDVAAMGPKATELAGRFADGWHALMFTEDGFEERYADLRRGAELGGRDPDDLRVSLVVQCCALDDGDRARELAAQHVAFYIGGMGTYYRDALARQGFEETAHAVHDAWQDRDREWATELVADELVDELAAVGTPEEARDRLADFAALDGVDDVSIGTPRGADRPEVVETLEHLAPE